MKIMDKFNKINALKYVAEFNCGHINEWVEAAKFDVICQILYSKDEFFSKDFLDELLKYIKNY